VQQLWQLVKDGHVAEARVRPIDGIGVELRFEWNGELAISQVFRLWDDLETAATAKRQELEARGWQWLPSCRLTGRCCPLGSCGGVRGLLHSEHMTSNH
jgi:hypothetical protein